MQFHHGTDWNRHRGVGSTLLENWVEERAVGERVLEERKDMAILNKLGHKDILIHAPGEHTTITTHKEAHQPFDIIDKNGKPTGKRRQLVEAGLMKRAIEETKDKPEDRSAKDWVSTNRADFGYENGNLEELGNEPPSEEEKARFAHAYTFWSENATKGTGTTICSTNVAHLASRGKGQDQKVPKGVASFGKHTDFSTPIEEYLKAPVKDL